MRGPLDALLDASVVLSFDRTGFRRHARRFHDGDLRRLDGKTCLVTGASSGVGRATAAGLARLGASVRLLCRNEARGLEARDALRRETGAPVELDVLDVADLAAIRAYGARVSGRVDVLVHNAGVLPAERATTKDGLEVTLATHVVGPWLLTGLLEPALRASRGRVIFVSSGGMYLARLSLDDLDWKRRPYDGVQAYAQTKRMQVVLARALADRLRGSGVACHAMHPGWADTEAVRTSLPRFWRLTRRILRSPAEGADTVVWLAAADEPGATSGRFWFDRQERSPWLVPGTRETEGEARRLVELVSRLAGTAAA